MNARRHSISRWILEWLTAAKAEVPDVHDRLAALVEAQDRDAKVLKTMAEAKRKLPEGSKT
jgi:hypothetical protein